ncbi:MAG: pirin family protein [Pseudobdellovibrio sp.]
MKKVIHIQKTLQKHWVGDGFPVRTIFTYNDLAKRISPFLLMDYAGPHHFPPTGERLGVGEHPHRGFETVTIVYDGQVEHRDSAGGGGVIQNGDVQWMTAASGLVHEEFHGRDFAKSGGRFEMVQLWVDLPKEVKMTKPRYQGIKNSQIPVVALPDEAGQVRVIAGEFQSAQGPALTHSPINLWDIKVKSGGNVTLTVPENHNASLFVLNGEIKISSGEVLEEAQLALLETGGTSIHFKAQQDTKMLFLGGMPLNQPVVGYGPFVMTSMDEIQQAFVDYNAGKMGTMDEIAGSEN